MVAKIYLSFVGCQQLTADVKTPLSFYIVQLDLFSADKTQ